MQKIKRCPIDNIIEEECVIVGEPSDALLQLQKEGHLVLCELKHLQGKSETEMEEALQEEEAVWQYKNICIDASALPEEYFERIWYRYKGQPVVIKETERLLIRESIPEDAKSFIALYEDEDVKRFLEVPVVCKEVAGATTNEKVAVYKDYIMQYAENQYAFYEYGMWSVVEKKNGKVIGRMGLENQVLSTGEEKMALGYALLPEFRGMGYACEACEAIVDYCIKCGYAMEIYVKIDPQNAKSDNLYKKLYKNSKISIKKM